MGKTLINLRSEKGQGIPEYALAILIMVLVVVALGLATAAGPLGTAISGLFTRVSTEIAGL